MKQYTRKQLKEYARLGLARDLTEVDPDTLPKWYEKIGVIVKVIGTRFFTPWTIGAVKRWPLLKQCILTLVQSGLYTMKRIPRKGRKI